MRQNFDTALRSVLKHEGGYVNNPADPGGMTNLGCTKRVWEAWVGHSVNEATMRALTPSDVAPLYKAHYWDKVRGDDLPTGVDYAVFDAAINSGVERAGIWLQEVVGATPDGTIGPKTLIALAAHSPSEVADAFNAKRLAFLQRLKTWPVFGRGWERRVQEVATVAQEMASQTA
jgi:lysozyme family protein